VYLLTTTTIGDTHLSQISNLGWDQQCVDPLRSDAIFQLHNVMHSDRIIEEELRGPSAEGTRVEAPMEVGFMEGVSPPQKFFFVFRAQNGKIWCILGATFWWPDREVL